MFDILTPAERHALAHKLADWACSFSEVGHVLARTALADHEYDGSAWDRRRRYVEIFDELSAIRTDMLAA